MSVVAAGCGGTSEERDEKKLATRQCSRGGREKDEQDIFSRRHRRPSSQSAALARSVGLTVGRSGRRVRTRSFSRLRRGGRSFVTRIEDGSGRGSGPRRDHGPRGGTRRGRSPTRPPARRRP